MKTIHNFKKLSIAVILVLSGAQVRSAAAGTYTFANPCQPFATITAINNTYGCYSFSVTNAGANDPNGYYSWNFGDGATHVGQYAYHCYSPVSAPTIYSIVVGYTGPSLCGVLPTEQTYTLLLNPPAGGVCIEPTPSITTSALTTTVWAGVAIPEIIFNYQFGDGTAFGNSNTYTYTACNNYIVTVKNWDMNSPQNVCYAYGAVNMNCPTYTITGIKEHRKTQLGAFPNPANDVLTIKSETILYGIKVVDLTGKEMMREEGQQTEYRLDVSLLPEGIYIVEATTREQTLHLKFMKR